MGGGLFSWGGLFGGFGTEHIMANDNTSSMFSEIGMFEGLHMAVENSSEHEDLRLNLNAKKVKDNLTTKNLIDDSTTPEKTGRGGEVGEVI